MPKTDGLLCLVSTYTIRASHLLQQDLDETFLLRAASWKFAPVASKSIEFAPRLERHHLQLWVAAVINEVEQVDEDGLEDLWTSVVLTRHTILERKAQRTHLSLPSDTA